MNYDLKDCKVEYACFVMGDWTNTQMIIWEVTYTDGSKAYELLKRVDNVTISIRCATLKEAVGWFEHLL